MADQTILIDMTDPSAPAPAGVGPAAPSPDVVVVPDDAADDNGLPAAAALQPDGSVILTLRYPVTMRWQRSNTDQVREDTHATLRMYRLNGAAMRAVMSAGQGNMVTTGIAKSCRMHQAMFDKVWDRMDAADTTAAAQVFGFFLYGGASTATGQPSSP